MTLLLCMSPCPVASAAFILLSLKATMFSSAASGVELPDDIELPGRKGAVVS
jgi:hypothetical protein